MAEKEPFMRRVYQGILVVVIVSFVTWLLGGWDPVVRGVGAAIYWGYGVISFVYGFATIKVWLPLFVPVLMGAVIIFLLLVMARAGRKLRIKEQQEKQQPLWLGYVQDEIFGVKWKWHWKPTPNGLKVDLVGAFCPICSLVLTPVADGKYNIKTHWFHCRKCNLAFAKGDGHPSLTFEHAEAEIHRRIETDEYPKPTKVMQQLPPAKAAVPQSAKPRQLKF